MRAIELLRRVFLVVGVFAAVAMFIWPVQAVWRVDVPDFARDQKRLGKVFSEAVRNLAADDEMADSIENPYGVALDEFITDRTEGRLMDVEESRWAAFYNDVRSTLSGSSRQLAQYLEDDYAPDHLYFPLDHEPLASLSARVGDGAPVLYLRMNNAQSPRYLSVVFQRSHDAMMYAPSAVAYPWRITGLWVFVAAVALYCLLPVRRRGSDEYGYRQGTAVVMPDWIGLVLATLFFALPIFIIPSSASSLRPWSLLSMEDGWGILTLVLWMMSLLCLANVAVGLWYATFSIRVADDRFRRRTLFSSQEYAFADIVAIEPATLTLPRWLKFLMVGLALFNWRALGPVLLGVTSSSDGMRLKFRDGRRLNIWLSHMVGAPRLVSEFARRDLQIDPALRQHYLANDLPPAPPAREARWRIGVLRAVMLLVVVIVAVAFASWPREVPTVRADQPVISAEAYARRTAIMREMQDISANMKRGLDVIKISTGDKRSAAVKEQDVLMQKFNALHAEFEQLEPPAAPTP